MSISVEIDSEIYDDMQVWWYTYELDNTNQTLIDDQFFSIVKYVPQFTLTERITVCTAIGCAESTLLTNIREIAQQAVECPDGFSVSISDSFKFAQGTYRYYSDDFRYMCDGIYQDILKTSASIRGYGGACIVNDVDIHLFTTYCVDWVNTILDNNSINILTHKFQDIIDSHQNNRADIQPGLVGDAFSKMSLGSELTVIPYNYKSRIPNNTVAEVTIDGKFEGKMFNGSIKITERIFSEMLKIII
jgi:hypothetical protein